MANPGSGKWTAIQRDLLRATYEVTYDEELRPNWDRIEERYNQVATHFGSPTRTNVSLRKQWSRMMKEIVPQHDPERVKYYSSLVRRLLGNNTLDSTNTTSQFFADSASETREDTLDSTNTTSQFFADSASETREDTLDSTNTTSQFFVDRASETREDTLISSSTDPSSQFPADWESNIEIPPLANGYEYAYDVSCEHISFLVITILNWRIVAVDVSGFGAATESGGGT